MRRTTLCLALLFSTLLPAATAPAAERIVQTFGNGDLNPALFHPAPGDRGQPPPVTASTRPNANLVKNGTSGVVEITAAQASATPERSVTVLVVDHPHITADDFALVGTLACGSVDGGNRGQMEGAAVLEMVADLPDGTRRVTRTVGATGPLAVLFGMEADHRFWLPLHTAAGQRPTRLTLNLLFPGRGRVWLWDLALAMDDPPAAADAVSLPGVDPSQPLPIPLDGLGHFLATGGQVLQVDDDRPDVLAATVYGGGAPTVILTPIALGPAHLTLWDARGHPNPLDVTVTPPVPVPTTGGRTLRLFTAADAAPTVAASGGPSLTGRARPLYGGSDPTPFVVEVESTSQADATLQLLNVPWPADARPGDALVGRVWIGQSTFPPANQSVRLGLQIEGSASALLEQADVPSWPPTDNAAAAQPPPIRLPITFDPAHRPDRIKLWLSMSASSYQTFKMSLVVNDLRLVHGGGDAPSPTTRPSADPSPPWPPAGTVEQSVRTFSGNDFDPRLDDADAQLAPVVGGSAYGNPNLTKITVTTGSAVGPRTIPILSVDDPGVTAARYAVTGTVQYGGVGDHVDVDGFGYLELVSDFPGGRRTVTRGLADAGPLRAIRGRSGPRPFALPVDAGADRPTRVAVNLVMSDRGTITLGQLNLVQYEPAPPTAEPATAAAAPTPPRPPTPWWLRPRTLTMGVGCFGGIGLVAAVFPLARRGRRGTGLLAAVVAVVGQAYFAWAMLIAGHGEPPHAWWPVLACAAVAFAASASVPLANRRHRDAELRRMRALDAVAAM